MEILRGAPALSEFRTTKLLANFAQLNLPVTGIYAEYMHFADLASELNASELEKLKKLLTYGPTIAEHQPVGELILVTPRPGTISPWSSKATDIANNCGLSQINRLERGIAYYVEGELSDEQHQVLVGELHDRMMEIANNALESAQQLFYSATPSKMRSVDILEGGKAALVAANTEMGLALADDAIDDVLTYALFPQIGLTFLEHRNNPEAFEPVPTKDDVKIAAASSAQDASGQQAEGYSVSVDGKLYDVVVGPSGSVSSVTSAADAAIKQTASVSAEETLNAPLAGNIFKVLASEGDVVAAGDVVMIMEAMKMETEIRAVTGGEIVGLHVKEGDAVAVGDTLLSLA